MNTLVSDQFEKKDADAILFSFYHVSYRKKLSKKCALKCQAWLVLYGSANDPGTANDPGPQSDSQFGPQIIPDRK